MEKFKNTLLNIMKRILYIFSNTNYRIKYNTVKLKYDTCKADFALINLHKDERITRLEKDIEKLKLKLKEAIGEEDE